MTWRAWRLTFAMHGVVLWLLAGAAVLLLIGFNSPATAESATQAPRTAAQLEQLVAPIALYPDALLSQALMASMRTSLSASSKARKR